MASVCHGDFNAATGSKIHSYKETLKEFCKRYDKKSEGTQKGMIGELISHILIQKKFPAFKTASPFFNMEEGSIKKGFDIILYDETKNSIWITEVKSGETKNNPDSKNISLLNIAKTDLKSRLNNNDHSIWLNAINGAYIVLKAGDVKTQVEKILNSIADNVVDGHASSSDKNVILMSVLFKSLTSKISVINVAKKGDSIIKENIFNNIIIISIQKGTYQKVIDFLKSEI